MVWDRESRFFLQQVKVNTLKMPNRCRYNCCKGGVICKDYTDEYSYTTMCNKEAFLNGLKPHYVYNVYINIWYPPQRSTCFVFYGYLRVFSTILRIPPNPWFLKRGLSGTKPYSSKKVCSPHVSIFVVFIVKKQYSS